MISSATLEPMRGISADQGVAGSAAQLFQSGAAGACFAGRQFAGPNPKLLRVTRKFAKLRFEQIRERLKASTKSQDSQQTGIVNPARLRRQQCCLSRSL